jgi:hypothetical protein
VEKTESYAGWRSFHSTAALGSDLMLMLVLFKDYLNLTNYHFYVLYMHINNSAQFILEMSPVFNQTPVSQGLCERDLLL